MKSMHCPLDGKTLHPATLATGQIHRCPECTGAFVPANILREVRAFSAIEFHRRSGVRDPLASSLSPARVACPNDAGAMAALVYKGIEIDVCPECRSVWLDAGELDKIAAQAKAPADAGQSGTDSRLEWIEETVDTVTSVDLEGLGGAVEFVADALGSLFDGISL